MYVSFLIDSIFEYLPTCLHVFDSPHHGSIQNISLDDVGEEPIYSDEEEDEPERAEEEESEEDEDDEEEDEFSGNRSETSYNSSNNNGKRRSATPPPPKLDARARFAANLMLLNGVHLGHVVQMLEKQCPAALESEPLQVPQMMEIIIDKIEPADTFNAVASYVAEKVGKSSISSKRVSTPKIEDVSNKRARK